MAKNNQMTLPRARVPRRPSSLGRLSAFDFMVPQFVKKNGLVTRYVPDRGEKKNKCIIRSSSHIES
jgi:hypothetical protein